jgi:hypothetical protein
MPWLTSPTVSWCVVRIVLSVKKLGVFVQWNQSKVEVWSQSNTVQCDPKVGMKSRGLLVRNIHLHAGRSYYSLGLSHVPTTRRTLGGKWGDGQLTVLSELLSRQLSHCAPNLSWQLCALTRYDVQGLTACGIWLWLARPAVLWVGSQLHGQGK